MKKVYKYYEIAVSEDSECAIILSHKITATKLRALSELTLR